MNYLVPTVINLKPRETLWSIDCQRTPLAFAYLNSFVTSSLERNGHGLAPLSGEGDGAQWRYLFENMERETGLESGHIYVCLSLPIASY